MSWPPDGSAEELRRAWAAADRDDAPSAETPQPDAERVWRAVAGELSPDEVRELAAAAAADPQVAQEWRLARELHAAMPRQAARARGVLPFRSLSPAVRWAAAAAVALALGAGLWLRLVPATPGPQPTLRGGEPGMTIAAAIPDGAALSRHDFVLRWSGLADPQARYTLRLTTADLQLVAEASDLAAPEHRVSPGALAAIAPGTRLLWQVDGRLPDGRVVSSTTAVVLLRD